MEKANTVTYKISKSTYIGVSQLNIIFILGHPLDLIKTRMQAKPKLTTTTLSQFKAIYSNSGILGFYNGGFPNFSRMVLKEIYRSPLRGFLKKFYTDVLPVSIKTKYPDLRNILTGISMATADVFISCPLERIKVWIMTSSGKEKGFKAFFSQQRENNLSLIRNLFKGLEASFYRSTLSWVSYLVLEERTRMFVIEKSPRMKSSNDDMPILEQVLTGIICGCFNSAITLPFDAAKTQIQKEGNLDKKSQLFKTILSIYKRNGLKGLYAGISVRLPHYVIVAVITTGNIQRIDKIWNSPTNSVNNIETDSPKT